MSASLCLSVRKLAVNACSHALDKTIWGFHGNNAWPLLLLLAAIIVNGFKKNNLRLRTDANKLNSELSD